MTAPVFKMPEFGQEADTYVAPVFDENDIWIRNFQEGKHRIRLLQEPGKFVTYRQHYDGNIKRSFPCTEDTQTCLGCTSENERTRKRPRQYAFNALDSDGRLNLFRVGVGVKEDMEAEAADRAEDGKGSSLLGVDVVITRTGKTMDDTKYRVKLGDEYEVPFTDDLYNIKQILATHYLQAMEASGIDVESLMEGQTDAAHEAPVTDIKTKAAAKKTTTKTETPTESIEDWGLAKLKKYCDDNGLEYEERGGRAALEPIVAAHLARVPF